MAEKKKAFTMHAGQLSARLFENYRNIIPRYTRAQKVEAYENPNKRVIAGKWTNAERKWAEKFEQMEFAIEKGRAAAALKIQEELLNRPPTPEEIYKTRELAQTKRRCNPTQAETDIKQDKKRNKTSRVVEENLYSPEDWIRQRFAVDPETGEEYELAVTLSAEDALIEALDAARAHNVSLDEFVNNPKYHTPDRKPGRPKKLEIV